MTKKRFVRFAEPADAIRVNGRRLGQLIQRRPATKGQKSVADALDQPRPERKGR